MANRTALVPRAHKMAETGYLEAMSLLSGMDDFMVDKNYSKALETLDYALEELQVVRDHLYRLIEKKK